MKKLVLVILLSFFSCQHLMDKPKNLIPKKEMANILADLALNDQLTYFNPSGNIEAGTRYILQKRNIKGKDFVDSYQYYILDKSINGIYQDAQDIIIENNPNSKKYILDKLEKTSKDTIKIQKLQ